MSLRLIKALTVVTSLFISPSLCQDPAPPCPLMGAVYEVPSQPSRSNAIKQAKNAFEKELVKAFKSDEKSTYGSLGYETSFSVEVYSIHETDAIHTHHWTAPKVPTTSGQKTVDGNSVFRVGSISKLMTTYVYLINAGFKGWNDPVTDYVPALKEYAAKAKEAPQDVVDWDEVTVGGLASHLSGMTTDGAPGASTDAKLAAAGLPKVPPVDLKFCGDPAIQQVPCEDEDFIKDINVRHPVLQTFADSPIYSNTAWRLFTMALEKITEKSYPDLFKETFVEMLGLNNTYYTIPESVDSSYIPVNASASWYDIDLRMYSPGGGYWSSVNDLRRIGASILNHTVISPSQTRHWMKPSVFTSNSNMTVGAPWEIYKAPIGRTQQMYTKSGDLGLYSSQLILLKEYGVGISIMAAGAKSRLASKTSRILADITTSIFVPALELASKENAAAVFAGTYSDEKTNSTITLEVRENEPGLTVSAWSMAGVEVIPAVGMINGWKKGMSHLYPTGLKSKDGKTTIWRAVFEEVAADKESLFDSSCMTWFGADRIVYGGTGAGEFAFSMSADGAGVEGLKYRMFNLALPKTGDSLLKKNVSSAAN